MKLTLLPFFASLFLIINPAQAQTSGGPDHFGYNWANNLDPIGSAPVYNWKNIKDTANLVKGLGDDNASGPHDLGFYYAYYGKWYNTLWIGSNGWISFQRLGNIAAPFPSIPTASAPDNFIAGLLSDLTLKDVNSSAVPGAAVYFWTNHTDSVIVQYDSIPFWSTDSLGYSGRNTFEIILDGAEHSITFQYKQLINSSPAYDFALTGLSIGIEDSTGDDGLGIPADTLPLASSAVKFYYPGHFSTNDLNNIILSLNQNAPNPCSDFTVINYTTTKSESIKVAVQNMLGEQIESHLIEKKPAGNYSTRLNTENYSPGIYFYTLSVAGSSSSGKMVVEK